MHRIEVWADDGKGKGNGAAMSAAKGVCVIRPARTEDMKSKPQRYFRLLASDLRPRTLLDNNIIFLYKGRGLGRGVAEIFSPDHGTGGFSW